MKCRMLAFFIAIIGYSQAAYKGELTLVSYRRPVVIIFIFIELVYVHTAKV